MSKTAPILTVLKARFLAASDRGFGLAWREVSECLQSHPDAVRVLEKMEETGGQPALAWFDEEDRALAFIDFSPESPIGRRSLCYDRAAWESRKRNKPTSDAMTVAKEIGVEILTVDQYARLQTLGDFDTKTSSWLQTPSDVRDLGGALFGDERYGRVFTYHNGADSYYAARGFRGILTVKIASG